MATYKISYLDGESYSHRGEHYINNVVDEYDAVENMINFYHLNTDNVKILSVDLVCE